MFVKRTHRGRSALLLAGVALAASSVGTAFAATSLTETGSSLLYPLFNLWVPAYTKKHEGVQINTAATGSGTGIAQSTQGIVQMGSSDAYLSGAQMKKHPSMLNIPVAISSQMINYNVPNANSDHLKLSGPVLADIYSGKIRYWDNKKIESMNSGAHLPHKRIVPIHRADGSGDTFLFTQFLTKSANNWKAHYGTTVSWPSVQGAIGATGNSGMVTALQNNPYSIAYIGVSYKDQTDKAGLGEAKLKNKSGNYVLPNKQTVPAAAAQMVPKTPKSERISLIYAKGKQSYPIINYEYVLVDSKQPNKETAKELKQFLTWAVSSDGGNSMEFLKPVHFMPLPAKARQLTMSQIDKIHG
ncbi:phosphate ABC transporter substrate-binding protein PstS [Salinisphaera hydrothermalis]|uniref:Phosphate-binding protein PstS n=1 Tax=Salinisphaera hydrothermalis (strain C41B8) TaxID=1304275 RepID=A0A084IQA3_SALHC|nr:phosphate ABC transporter substrate-binding protein PstS [Salinisphaera hydrothermalis]KEZ78887.1 phosphate ABC transporter substrate-binding protein [Salinisphaera hydrothermalis C41B8]